MRIPSMSSSFVEQPNVTHCYNCKVCGPISNGSICNKNWISIKCVCVCVCKQVTQYFPQYSLYELKHFVWQMLKDKSSILPQTPLIKMTASLCAWPLLLFFIFIVFGGGCPMTAGDKRQTPPATLNGQLDTDNRWELVFSLSGALFKH